MISVWRLQRIVTWAVVAATAPHDITARMGRMNWTFVGKEPKPKGREKRRKLLDQDLMSPLEAKILSPSIPA